MLRKSLKFGLIFILLTVIVFGLVNIIAAFCTIDMFMSMSGGIQMNDYALCLEDTYLNGNDDGVCCHYYCRNVTDIKIGGGVDCREFIIQNNKDTCANKTGQNTIQGQWRNNKTLICR